ncbi:hypothetical protein GCM10023100_06940 [Actinocorallia cavernae]|uniref:Fluoride-specific ion channel FluC n=2 Tax=Actinomycetes TaxID=1760 RepID=A0ABN3LSF0_9ACTN
MGETQPSTLNEPTDPDVDLHAPAQRRELRSGQWSIIAAVAAGGAIGACARYGAAQLWPTPGDVFPWTTFWVNVVGCGVIGVFMVIITDVWAAHRLVRPFFGTGVLGGFTTFSTYVVDIQRLVDHGRPSTGLYYLAATVLSALAAVWTGAHLTRQVTKWRQS